MLFLLKRLSFVIAIFLIIDSNIYTQSRSNALSNGFIPEGGFITIFGHHSFMEGSGFVNPGVIKTFRSSDPGYIVYAKNSTWAGASHGQFVDGYVKTFHTGAFTFPIGQYEYYRPIMLHKAAKSLIGYYRDDPNTISDVLNKGVDAISNEEYWKMTLGLETKITCTWDESSELNIEKLDKLSIIGLNKQGYWELIPSEIENTVLNKAHFDGSFHPIHKSSLGNGSITTLSEISPETYQYITLGYKEEPTESNFTVSVYPNPQFVGLNVIVKLEDFNANSLEVKIHTTNNGLLFNKIVEVSPFTTQLELPYSFKESGPYILTLISKKTVVHKNIVVVDP